MPNQYLSYLSIFYFVDSFVAVFYIDSHSHSPMRTLHRGIVEGL